MLQDSNLKDEQFLTLFLMTIYSGDIGTRAGSKKTFRMRTRDLYYELTSVLLNKEVYILYELLIVFQKCI